MSGLYGRVRRVLRHYSPRPRFHQWLFRRSVRVNLPFPIASFTFDDFPRSALVNGGRLLRKFEAHGTYYAALGLMDTEDSQGPAFTLSDLKEAFAQGHELACHTFSHAPARRTPMETFENEILRNRHRAEELLPGCKLRNFAYPGGEVTLRVKRRMRRYAFSSRGTYVGIVRDRVDLDLLPCQHLFQSTPMDHVRNLVEECQRRPGWLVFYGHDVREEPTVYGCTPEYLSEVLATVSPVCRILTVADALAVMGVVTREHYG